ncbi:cytochrome P450 [Minicystis rosea]|nr:cytochrome P450 [Minicystis rosea]
MQLMNIDDLPVLSGADRLGHLRELAHERLSLFARFNRECGAIGRIFALRTPIVIVNAPELIHGVLIGEAKSFIKPTAVLGPVRPLVGDGLSTSDGDLWSTQRKLMAPLFTQAHIEAYADTMVEHAWSEARALREGQVVDALEEMMRITMRVAGKTLFDAEVRDEADDLTAAITIALCWADEQIGSIPWAVRLYLASLLQALAERVPASMRAHTSTLTEAVVRPIHWPTVKRRRADAALATIERRIEQMIADRRRAGLDRPDLLSLLLATHDEHGDRMSDKQVRDEIVTLFIAGHETTATALTWSLYLLGRHPEAHARAQAEARALGDRRPRAADLPSLRYCLQVFKEAMRLYPPIYLFGRQAANDVRIGDVDLPKGTIVLVSAYALHRRPELWPDPERFDPSRFEPQAEHRRHRLAYLPFSAGPRTCIGNHFAMMEGPLVLATILARVDFALGTSDPIEPRPFTTLRPWRVPLEVTAVRP